MERVRTAFRGQECAFVGSTRNRTECWRFQTKRSGLQSTALRYVSSPTSHFTGNGWQNLLLSRFWPVLLIRASVVYVLTVCKLRVLWIAFYAYSARYVLTFCMKIKAALPCCVTRTTITASWEGWRHTVRSRLGGSSLQMIAKVVVVWLGKERVSMMFRAQFLVS
jgi:hypothetical protein